MYRHYNAHPLLLDINLLISVFPVVLADALDRVLSTSVEAFPQVDTDIEFSAAEAG
jgi:hypothetical protein